MPEQQTPAGRYSGLPVYINDNLVPGSWSAHNMMGELLTITYVNGQTIDFRKEDDGRLVLGPHNIAWFCMPKPTWDKLVSYLRDQFKLVSNEG